MTYIHELTEIETLCGVTLDEVAELLPRGLFIDGDSRFVLPAGLSPALTMSTARVAFNGLALFLGINQFAQPVYSAIK